MAHDDPLKNHLGNERSLYLRQHASNPIDWYPWCEAALRRSREEDKPIFLSIGYSSCHWCHVMEHEVFEKHDVAAFMNEHFICIKVDREERPDLDATYMQAVQMMTGGGGWPMSVFLTPRLQPFFGGTYFPHRAFVDLTERILDVFRNRRDEVDQQASSLAAVIQSGLDGAPAGQFDASLFDTVVREAQGSYDRQWGGLQARMKFPTPVRWHFLLHLYRLTGDESMAEMIRGTLDHMGSGGIRDHLGGGFHRYTVDNTWLVPHFEKMLYDNAQLASLYLEAAVTFQNDFYREVARETLDFILREMRDAGGGFYASFDADSDGVEGTFYIWEVEEFSRVAGPQDGALLASLFGATEQGNFEGKSVLWRNRPIAEVAEQHGRTIDQVRSCFDKWRPALLQHRAKRVPPTLDRKIVTAWNGLTIQALARAASALDDPNYLDAAKQAIDYLWRVHRTSNGKLLRVSNDGHAANDGILDDYGALAVALLDLYQATGDLEYIDRARSLVDQVIDRFDRPGGGLFLTDTDTPTPIGRRFDPFDNVEPSGNALALEAMSRLASLCGQTALRERVATSLDATANVMRRAGLEMAGWLDVALHHQGPTHAVVVAGKLDDPITKQLVRVVRDMASPRASLIVVPAEGPDERVAKTFPTSIGKTAVNGNAMAYVCTFGACKAPTSDPTELRSQLMGR